MTKTSDRIIQLIVNWFALLTAPIWVIPASIYTAIVDRCLLDVYVTGKKSFVSDSKNEDSLFKWR